MILNLRKAAQMSRDMASSGQSTIVVDDWGRTSLRFATSVAGESDTVATHGSSVLDSSDTRIDE